jgi:hypothetical protein
MDGMEIRGAESITQRRKERGKKKRKLSFLMLHSKWMKGKRTKIEVGGKR